MVALQQQVLVLPSQPRVVPGSAHSLLPHWRQSCSQGQSRFKISAGGGLSLLGDAEPQLEAAGDVLQGNGRMSTSISACLQPWALEGALQCCQLPLSSQGALNLQSSDAYVNVRALNPFPAPCSDTTALFFMLKGDATMQLHTPHSWTIVGFLRCLLVPQQPFTPASWIFSLLLLYSNQRKITAGFNYKRGFLLSFLLCFNACFLLSTRSAWESRTRRGSSWQQGAGGCKYGCSCCSLLPMHIAVSSTRLCSFI